MSRYIDADLLQEDFKADHGGKRSLMIDTQPTADVVEIVRCKDCKYYNAIYTNRLSECEKGFETYGNDYCSYGERR